MIFKDISTIPRIVRSKVNGYNIMQTWTRQKTVDIGFSCQQKRAHNLVSKFVGTKGR